MRRDGYWWAVGTLWLVAIGSGLAAWERYDSTAGAIGPRPNAAESAAGQWRLTAYFHPHCPCARATVGELAELVRLAPELSVRVVFVQPAGTADGWGADELWEAVSRLPGVERARDVGGREARGRGAETSGHVVLTNPEGRIVFGGGLTRGRGLEGESPGRRAVLDWLGNRPAAADARVFGCPLFNETE